MGAKYLSDEQRSDMKKVAGQIKSYGLLDYVTAWYFKAAHYIQDSAVTVAFVSTNSITQGEQVGVLWSELFRLGLRIEFGHRTFAWVSEARGKAHVHVVIIGCSVRKGNGKKRLYDYETDAENPTVVQVRHISPYLVQGGDTVVMNRRVPLCDSPKMGIGNKPIDDGNYLFLPEERDEFVSKEPKSKKWFRRWLGSDEFLYGWERWCLCLHECPPNELRAMPMVVERVANVRKLRQASKSAPTRAIAKTPTLFHVQNIPTDTFMVVPKVSSERRRYIPIGFMKPETLISDLCFIVADATVFHFGVMSSSMHVAWLKLVAGRLKSDFRYSVKLVYNNFPWPVSLTEKQKAKVETKAQAVIDARALFPDSSLADLYDPLAMPTKLLKAHNALDRAVESCYRSKQFESDRERVEFLFGLYEKMMAVD